MLFNALPPALIIILVQSEHVQLFEKLEIHMNRMGRTINPCPEQILCQHQRSLVQINQRSGDSPTCLAQREMPANLNSVFFAHLDPGTMEC